MISSASPSHAAPGGGAVFAAGGFGSEDRERGAGAAGEGGGLEEVTAIGFHGPGGVGRMRGTVLEEPCGCKAACFCALKFGGAHL